MPDKPFRGRLTWDAESKTFKEHVQKNKEIVPEFINDELPEPVQSNATFEGKKFTSKSKLRQHYRDHGFQETGGTHLAEAERERRREQQPKSAAEKEKEEREDKELLEQAYMDVKYGRVEFSEKEKELHKKEAEKWGSKWKVRNPY